MAEGWNPVRVEAFRAIAYEFLGNTFVNSKELGGHTCLGDHIYRAQNMFLDGVFGALADGVHDISILKSRQLGISTVARALSILWLGMHDGLQGAMVFDTAYNTARARREIIGIIRDLPKSVKFPRIREDNRDGIILENDSQLLFMAAGVKNSRTGGGLGRSVGLNFVHASEMCSWNNDEGLTSFRQSLSEEYPDRLYLWESTARGFNSWHDMWTEAREDDAKRALFFGWWAKDNQEIARGTTDFEKYGVEPPNPSELKRIHAVKDMYGWDITQEQLAWYRKRSDPTQEREEGEPEDTNLVQEQPWTEDEAFQQTGSTFFEADRLTQVSARIATTPRPQTFRFHPGDNFVDADFYPARTRREMEVKIWEEPVQDSTYIVAGDPAFGHNEYNNNSAAQVMRCFADGIDQVAEYATATIQPHQFAQLLWSLVGYYGAKPNNRILMICELNGPGEEVWRQYRSIQGLLNQGYMRAAAEKKGIANIANNARNYVFQRSDSLTSGHSLQWKTATQNKVQIFEACRNYLHSSTLLVRSIDAVEEMKSITRDGDSIGAPGNKRDDRTFALALGVRAWDEKLRRGLITGNRTRESERAKLSLSIIDQYALFNRSTLDYFLKEKQATREGAALQAMRAQRRASTGMMRRLVPATRRF